MGEAAGLYWQRPRRWWAVAWRVAGCRTDCSSEVSVGEGPGGVLPYPADPYGLDGSLTDRVGIGDPEFPMGEVEHIVGCRVSLRLHAEDENISADSRLGAVLVACCVEFTRDEPSKSELGMPLQRPALQVCGAFDLDGGPIGRRGVVVIPADPQAAFVAYCLGDEELGENPACGIVAQIAEGPSPEIRNRGVQPGEALSAIQWHRHRGCQPVGSLLRHNRSLRSPLPGSWTARRTTRVSGQGQGAPDCLFGGVLIAVRQTRDCVRADTCAAGPDQLVTECGATSGRPAQGRRLFAVG